MGMCFFVYNWWRCRQSRVLLEENEMNRYDFDEEDYDHKNTFSGSEDDEENKSGEFKPANIYKE